MMMAYIDAKTFQKPLGDLTETLAQKVKREAPATLSGPGFIAVDLHVLIRQAMRTYDLLFYINADDRRKGDCFWKPEYSIVALPLVRNMIDCLYNITAILQDPRRNGPWFRKSGYKRALKALDADMSRYGGQKKWDDWISERRKQIEFDIRVNDLDVDDITKTRRPEWPTMGKYIADKPKGGNYTPHQEFLRRFTYGPWREYSAMAHGAFEGLTEAGKYYVADSMPHEERPKLEEFHFREVSMHLARSATILLCLVTELQAFFRFDGARINERIRKMWTALMPVFEAEELYNERYAQLMKDRNMTS